MFNCTALQFSPVLKFFAETIYSRRNTSFIIKIIKYITYKITHELFLLLKKLSTLQLPEKENYGAAEQGTPTIAGDYSTKM